LFMADSGLTMITWLKLEASSKEPLSRSAILMTSEFLILKLSFGLDLELVVHLQNIDLVIQWTFLALIFYFLEDGQRRQERASSTSQQKKAATTL